MAAKRTSKTTTKRSDPARKGDDEIVNEVLAGQWGTGEDRKTRLKDEGYDYDKIQTLVNRRVGGGAPAAYRSSLPEIAQQVIDGHYGEPPEQRRLLEGGGWNYASVLAEVKRLGG